MRILSSYDLFETTSVTVEPKKGKYS
jgi:hypothetical protein